MRVRVAFVPGAGLGKRLRPLTEERPKPLVPVRNRPLITYVFDSLLAVGIERIVVNTHHCPDVYAEVFPDASYRGCPLTFVHEPVLLETAGGLENARAHFGPGPVLVHNGDLLADMNLAGLLETHAREGREVTALLRSSGGPLHVLFDRRSERIRDIRDALGAEGGIDTLFAGAYVVESAFLDRIPPRQVISVIPIFLDMLRGGVSIAGRLDDSGAWADLGDRASYLSAHAGGWTIDPSAEIAADAEFLGFGAVGAGAKIGAGAVLADTVVWPGAEIASGARLRGCIVRDRRVAQGEHADTDF